MSEADVHYRCVVHLSLLPHYHGRVRGPLHEQGQRNIAPRSYGSGLGLIRFRIRTEKKTGVEPTLMEEYGSGLGFLIVMIAFKAIYMNLVNTIMNTSQDSWVEVGQNWTLFIVYNRLYTSIFYGFPSPAF